MKFLLIKPPQKNEYTIANSIALFSSLITKTPPSGILSWFSSTPPVIYSFNYIAANQTLYFVVGSTDADYSHLKNQMLAQYGKSDVVDLDLFEDILKVDYSAVDYGEIALREPYYIPLKNYDAADADPLASILSAMSRSPDPKSFFWIQCILKPAGTSWQRGAVARISKLSSAEVITQSKQNEISLIQEKVKYHGFHVNIRVITDNPANTSLLASTFTIFSRPGGNQFKFRKPNFLNSKKILEGIKNHKNVTPCILNTLEISTIWHLPNSTINIPNIAWGKRLALDAPENLPIAHEGMTDEEKKNLTFIGKTEYKNKQAVFGIKSKDRLRHVYIVGKTGSGKSWMINNMAIEDIRKGYGVAVLDPHGDAVDAILDYIPKNRINDVCYFNPSDPDYSYPLNVLEVSNYSQRELVVSGIIGIFYKLYSHSWGPRMEHILRNALFTLVHADNATLPDIVKILSNKGYRNRVLQRIDDPLIHAFWKNEFEGADAKFIQESISPILNKVGQFITSPMIRKIIAYPKSKVKIQDMMDNRKIFLCDLSQGKLGEDNAALLGSMLITQIQLCAMNRAFIPEEQRVPFYLYVDEFQNFATKSFTKILSEARKYKLGLILANQYITQIDEEVMGAILGNIGNITTFNIGAKDADILHKEFGSEIEAEDLTTMNKFQMLTRLTVDNSMTKTFSSYSLPLPKNMSGHRERIIEQSRKRYGIYIGGGGNKPEYHEFDDNNQPIPQTKTEAGQGSPKNDQVDQQNIHQNISQKPLQNQVKNHTEFKKTVPTSAPIKSKKQYQNPHHDKPKSKLTPNTTETNRRHEKPVQNMNKGDNQTVQPQAHGVKQNLHRMPAETTPNNHNSTGAQHNSGQSKHQLVIKQKSEAPTREGNPAHNTNEQKN